MKSIFVLLVLSVFMAKAQEIEKALQEIRQEYHNIESNLSDYTTKTISVDHQSTEGGYATAYLQDNQIKAIKAGFAGETGKNFYDFYYNQEGLLFVLATRHQYNRPFYWDAEAAKESGDNEVFDEAKTKIVEQCYYFKNDVLIHGLDNDKKKVNLEEEKMLSGQKELLELSETLKKDIAKY
ncbi:hypothetical protein [Maribacter sp. 2210JD10-5]|uniref:hypothetical protein n=1 Tax=Maribacter sp. 2210JD10-5 TaxID=3386272 RepID=UPI0039BCBCB5